MRWVILSLLLPLIVGCYGAGDYVQARNPTVRYIDPKDYRVDPNLYPKYRAIKDFQPPDVAPNPYNEPHLKMPRITKDYVWEVRHRVGDKIWIFSKRYEEQRCLIEHCYGTSVYEISISNDGRVEAGWRGIKNPNHVLLKGDRIIPLGPDPRYDLEWGNEPLFVQLKEENK